VLSPAAAARRADHARGDQRPVAAYRDALGLPRELSPHSMRHAYVTHLTEDGADPLFVQQAGHSWASTTAVLHVSADFMNTALRKAISPAFDAPSGAPHGAVARLGRRCCLRRGRRAPAALASPR
jgi:hypothetical protein